MPCIAVAATAGVKREPVVAAALQSYFLRIELSRADLKRIGTVFAAGGILESFLRQQQVIKRRHRAVMQIWRRRPNAVQRTRFVGVQRCVRIGGCVWVVIPMLQRRFDLVSEKTCQQIVCPLISTLHKIRSEE